MKTSSMDTKRLCSPGESTRVAIVPDINGARSGPSAPATTLDLACLINTMLRYC